MLSFSSPSLMTRQVAATASAVMAMSAHPMYDPPSARAAQIHWSVQKSHVLPTGRVMVVDCSELDTAVAVSWAYE